MCRDQNHAQIFGHKSHRVFFTAGQVREKFRMTGKTITSEKKRALIYWRCGYRIDAAGGAELDGGFYITCCRSTRGAGFNAGLNKTADVVEMINYRLEQLFRNWFTFT